MSNTKAIFLDRDGTIIFDGNYISKPGEVKLLPGAKEALSLLQASGFLLFLFTNQSGIGRGYFAIDAVYRCNARMLELLDLGSPLFTDVCIAPESPDQPTVYRKPNPRFINESVARFGLDRTKSWMVGDKLIDAESGLNAGINAALVGGKTVATTLQVSHHESLFAFAQAITNQSQPT